MAKELPPTLPNGYDEWSDCEEAAFNSSKRLRPMERGREGDKAARVITPHGFHTHTRVILLIKVSDFEKSNMTLVPILVLKGRKLDLVPSDIPGPKDAI